MSHAPNQLSQPPPLPEQAPPSFLNVAALLENSHSRPRHNWLLPGMAAFIVVILGSTYLSGRSPKMKALVDGVSVLVMLALAVGMAGLMWRTVRRQREERLTLEAIEEAMQLRRWQQAAAMLQTSLSRAAVTYSGRVQMLIFLATVLARYGRFDEAIAVQNHLLEETDLDPSTEHALHLGRAMAMLRQDHLVDADRAINELRRNAYRAIEMIESARKAQNTNDIDPIDEGILAKPGSQDDIPIPRKTISAGLALIEMYRDVKTGHPAEAIAQFHRALPAMRKQLGHRVGDAYALVAKAFDFSNDAAQAQLHWEKATSLGPASELLRRYPELSPVAAKYRAAEAPADYSADLSAAARSEAA